MKSLVAFLITVAAASSALATGQYCADVSNTWTISGGLNVGGATGNDGPATLIFSQATNGGITGTVQNVNCQGTAYTSETLTLNPERQDSRYNGLSTDSVALGNGTFHIFAGAISSQTFCWFAATVTIPFASSGCVSNVTLGTIGMTGYCLIPNTGNGSSGSSGEADTAQNWVANTGETQYTLYPRGPYINGFQDTVYDWRGRTFEEQLSGFTYYVTNCVPLITLPNEPAPFQIGANGTYYDFVGWPGNYDNEFAIGAERTAGPIPCGQQNTQKMLIDCPGGYVQYQSHTNWIEIVDNTLVSVSRNGIQASPATIPFGMPKAVWVDHASPMLVLFYKILHP